MNMFEKLLSLGLLFALQQADCVAMQESQVGEKRSCEESSERVEKPSFLERFAPPAELQALIDAHKKEILDDYEVCSSTRESHPKILSVIPGYFVKWDNETRAMNAGYMREVIEKNNLNLLKVPQKYVCEIDGKKVVFAQAIPVLKGKEHYFNGESLTLEEVKQIVILLKKTGYRDFCGINIIRDEQDKKMAFIDTENKSFSHGGSLFFCSGKSDEDRDLDILFSGLSSVEQLYHYHQKWMTQEAQDWLKAEANL